MLGVAIPRSEAGGLMRSVAQHPAHLLSVQAGGATRRCCRAKKGRNTMRAPMTLGLKALTAQSHGKARTNVVAERGGAQKMRSEEHTSELQSRFDLVCRLLLEKKKNRRSGED